MDWPSGVWKSAYTGRVEVQKIRVLLREKKCKKNTSTVKICKILYTYRKKSEKKCKKNTSTVKICKILYTYRKKSEKNVKKVKKTWKKWKKRENSKIKSISGRRASHGFRAKFYFWIISRPQKGGVQTLHLGDALIVVDLVHRTARNRIIIQKYREIIQK
jgi:hypothetical protein